MSDPYGAPVAASAASTASMAPASAPAPDHPQLRPPPKVLASPRYSADKLSVSSVSPSSSSSSPGSAPSPSASALSPSASPRPQRRPQRNMKNLSLNLHLSRPQLASPGTVVTASGNVYKNKSALDDHDDHDDDDSDLSAPLKTPMVASTPTQPPAVTAHFNHSNDSLTLHSKRVAAAARAPLAPGAQAPPSTTTAAEPLLAPPPPIGASAKSSARNGVSRTSAASASATSPSATSPSATSPSATSPSATSPSANGTTTTTTTTIPPPLAAPSTTQLRSPLVFQAPSDCESSSSITVSPIHTPPVASTLPNGPTPPAPERYSMVSSEPSQSIFSDHFDKHQSVVTDHRVVLDKDDQIVAAMVDCGETPRKTHERDNSSEGDDYRNGRHPAPKRPPRQAPPGPPRALPHGSLAQPPVSSVEAEGDVASAPVAHYPQAMSPRLFDDDDDMEVDVPPAVPEKTNEELLRSRTVHKKHQSRQLRHQRSSQHQHQPDTTHKSSTLDHLASLAKKQKSHPTLEFEPPLAPAAAAASSSQQLPSSASERRRRVRLSPSELNAKALPPLPNEVSAHGHGSVSAQGSVSAPASSAVTTPELPSGTITTTLLTPNSRPSSSASSVAHTTVTYVPYTKLPEELQEKNSLNAYSSGPRNVLNNRIFLYSDPQLSPHPVDINDFDLVVNVAKECRDLSAEFITRPGAEYLYVPWQHTSHISRELPEITDTIARYYDRGRRILVHCQCGVSRSACVIVAFFMMRFSLGVNQAYELLKSGTAGVTHESVVSAVTDKGNRIDACDRICPNMSLIFELMEFGDHLKRI